VTRHAPTPLTLKLRIINHWNASCYVRAKRKNNEDERAMEVVKIYFLVALIGAIAAASRRKVEPESPHQTQ
jgi:hypothetical protein